jgi:hypothetical protein
MDEEYAYEIMVYLNLWYLDFSPPPFDMDLRSII